jgi:hypothetical protein
MRVVAACPPRDGVDRTLVRGATKGIEVMTEPPLDPQCAYEALAQALRLFYAQPPTDQTLTTVRDAVTHAAEVQRKCELQRATSTKEFRAHVVRLRLLLAGVYQTLDVLPGVPCRATAPSYPAVSPAIRHEKH